MNESFKHCVKWNKPVTKGQILYESTWHMQNKQVNRNLKYGRSAEESYCLMNIEFLYGNVLKIVIMVANIINAFERKWSCSVVSLCHPMDCSPPGSYIHGIFQTGILEWVAISFSRGSSGPRDQTQVSHIAGRLFTIWATRGTAHLKIVKMVYWGVILLLYYIYKTQN